MPMKVGYEHDTLDGAPDLMDEEVLQEVPDVSCQETDIDFDIASRQKGILILMSQPCQIYNKMCSLLQ